MLDQSTFDAVKKTFEEAGMGNAVALMTKLYALEEQGYTLRPFEVKAYTRKGEPVVIPFGTLDGTRTIWDAMRTLGTMLEKLDAERRELFDCAFEKFLQNPLLSMVIFLPTHFIQPTSYAHH